MILQIIVVVMVIGAWVAISAQADFSNPAVVGAGKIVGMIIALVICAALIWIFVTWMKGDFYDQSYQF